MVYARKVGEKAVTLQVSGQLWNRSLVMRDTETGSLWSHLLGRCMEGSLKGADLELLSGVMTTWDDWKRENPDTTVLNLPRSSRGYDKSFYSNPESGSFSGRLSARSPKRSRSISSKSGPSSRTRSAPSRC